MTRHRLPMLLAVAAVFTLSGCSGGGAIDIPEGAAAPMSTTAPEATTAPATDAPAAVPATTETAVPTIASIDCAAALPPATIADDLDLPDGFVTTTTGGGAGSCNYTIAGNTGAVQFSWTSTTQTADEVLGQLAEDTPGAERVVFGDGALISRESDGTDAPQTVAMVSLAGGIQLTSYSYVGDEDELRTFARAIYAALGVTVG